MFERFTDLARHVVVLAQDEARVYGYNYIGPEHLLLGLVFEPNGIPAKILLAKGITAEAVLAAIKDEVGPGPGSQPGHIPFTAKAKQVLERSLREALMLGHNYIGAEHLLLGIIRQGDSVALAIITKLYGEPAELREEVLVEIGRQTSTAPVVTAVTPVGHEERAITIPENAAIGFLDWFKETHCWPNRAGALPKTHPLQVLYEALQDALQHQAGDS